MKKEILKILHILLMPLRMFWYNQRENKKYREDIKMTKTLKPYWEKAVKLNKKYCKEIEKIENLINKKTDFTDVKFFHLGRKLAAIDCTKLKVKREQFTIYDYNFNGKIKEIIRR